MIRRDRNTVAVPGILASKRAQTERQRAEAFYAALRETTGTRPATASSSRQANRRRTRPAARSRNTAGQGREINAARKFNFQVYKEDEVKRLLYELFRGKCAYCEARYIATQPMDVEHFRPKSEVTDFDGSKQVGYYWLAAEWTNLLPSCIDCNRPRNHLDKDGKPVRLGKDTLFPLAPNSPRASFGAAIEDERPLLLDPCRDRPEEYLAFSEAVAGPSNAPAAPADAPDRVSASLRVYGLNRTDLVQERRQVLLNLRRRCHQIRALTLALETAQSVRPEAARAMLVRTLGDLVSHEAQSILRMADPDEPYSLMVRQEIAAFEAEIGHGLDDTPRQRLAARPAVWQVGRYGSGPMKRVHSSLVRLRPAALQASHNSSLARSSHS